MTQKNFPASLLVGELRRQQTAQEVLSVSYVTARPAAPEPRPAAGTLLARYTRALPPERSPHECADTRDRNSDRAPYDGFTESWD